MYFCYNEQTSKNTDTIEVIRECGRQGVRYIEIRKEKLLAVLRREHSLAPVRNALEDNGVKPVCLDALHRITFNDARGFVNVCDLAELLCSCCLEIGSPLLMVAATMLPDKGKEETEKETAECLEKLSEIVRPYGIGLSLEFHGSREASVRGFSQALDIVRRANCGNAGLCVDTWNMYRSGSRPEELLKAGGTEIYGVHLCDSTPGAPFEAGRHESSLWPGDGAADVADMLKKLSATGYNGPVSVEIYGKAAEGMSVRDAIRMGKEKTLAVMERAGVII